MKNIQTMVIHNQLLTLPSPAELIGKLHWLIQFLPLAAAGLLVLIVLIVITAYRRKRADATTETMSARRALPGAGQVPNNRGSQSSRKGRSSRRRELAKRPHYKIG